jgi:hypothetical protein
LDVRHFNHAAEVAGRLLEPREDAAALLEPADESFDDVSIAVRLAVEVDQPRIAILVGFGRDDRRDAFA